MAVVRHTQKDVGNYKAKLFGPFTTKQVVTLAPGIIASGAIGYLMYNMGLEIVLIFMIVALIMAPLAFFAFAHPYDMEPADYLKDYYNYHMKRPKKRYYVVESFDDLVWERELKNMSEEERAMYKKDDVAPKHKENPNYPSYF